MPSQMEGTLAAVGMIMTIVAVSVVIPGLFIALDNPQTTAFEQAQAERIVITGDLSSQVTQITNQQEVNVTFLDRKTGETASTGQMQIGDTVSVTIEGETINVTLKDTLNTDAAVLVYEYPLYIGWPDGSEVIVKNMPDLLIIATLVGLIGTILVLWKVFMGS